MNLSCRTIPPPGTAPFAEPSDAALLSLASRIAEADRVLTGHERAYREAERAARGEKHAIAALDVAEAVLDQAQGRLYSLVRRALAMPVHTLAGCAFKLSLTEHVHDAGVLLAALARDVGAMKGSTT